MSYDIFSIAFAAFAFSAPALAQHGGDILLTIETGRITTGLIDDGGIVHSPVRVFESTLGETFPNFADEPGFDSAVGTFPVPSRIGFRILDALRTWDGSDFHTLSPSAMEIGFSTLSVTTPTAPSVVEGFTLAVTANGEWHRHMEYTLHAPATDGVYLLNLVLYSTDAATGESLPFWVVFNQNRSEVELDAAVQWVKDNLAGGAACGTADFDGDGDSGTDADIEAFFSCLAGTCCAACWGADFDGDGDTGTDADIEAFFRVLAGGVC